jgi:hypothetical protein
MLVDAPLTCRDRDRTFTFTPGKSASSTLAMASVLQLVARWALRLLPANTDQMSRRVVSTSVPAINIARKTNATSTGRLWSKSTARSIWGFKATAASA